MEEQIQEPEVVLDQSAMLSELLDWATKFQDRSAEWRRNSYEPDWLKWQRNADSRYDPDIAAKKDPNQSKAVWPITAAHRENAQAQLYKTEMGPQPPIKFKAQVKIPPELDQSQNLQDLVVLERDKSGYDLERNKVLEDKTTYGSGFARVRFETVTEPRVIKVPELEPVLNPSDPMAMFRHMSGQPRVTGYRDEVQEVVTYRGTRFEHLSVWDIFPDPKALKIEGNPIAYRYETTYGEIVDGVQAGYYLPGALALKSESSQEDIPLDRQQLDAERKIADARVERTERGKMLRCYELYARLPQKWVLINGEPMTDPEALIPARICFHPRAVICVEVNDSYDGEAPIIKDDYFPVAGQFYGRGIPEMLKDVQLVSSETINQRLDSGSVGLTQRFAVLEKSLVDSKDLEDGRKAVRLKAPNGVIINDIKQVIGRLDMGGPDSSAFIEPQEWERVAQERTSITRATLGTSGQVKDANQTLGGQEMLKEASGDKLAFIGMLSEAGFIRRVTRIYLRLIYQNYTPEDYAEVLGPEAAMTFIPMIPEQAEAMYRFIPQGIYTMENKAMRQARLAQIDAQFGMMPYFNRLAILQTELQAADEDPAQFILGDAEAIQIMVKAKEMSMAQQAQAEQEQGPQKPAAKGPKK